MSRLRAYWRFLLVVLKFLPTFISYARDRRRFVFFGEGRDVDTEFKKDRAEKIKSKMLSLGPTFIKLGQVLSTRPDVLPPEYTDVFSTLQDEVPPAPWKDVRQVFVDELGDTVDEIYDDFNKEAISGASLGQVYTATYEGQEVAVKVRRPNIEKKVKADVQVLKWLTPVLMRFVGDARAFSLETLSDEFSQTLIEEMDYDREKNELETVRQNFRQNPKVIIPEPVESCSSDRILTMEYIEGTKIDNLEEIEKMSLDKEELAERIQVAYFEMVIEHGVFHADPHPGNLAVKPDGSIVFYDFGMTGRIDEETRDKIVEFYASVATDNPEDALDSLIDLGIIDPDADREIMIRILKLAIKDARGEQVEQRQIEDILRQVEDRIYEFPFRLPPKFSLLLRVATIANGVCLKLNPNLDFISVITELLKENGYIEDSVKKVIDNNIESFQNTISKMSALPSRIDEAVANINEGNIEASVSLEDKEFFEYLTRQVVRTVFVSGFVVAGSILYSFVGEIEGFIVYLLAGLAMLRLIWASMQR
jgi:predicted unusual protein kinase regulating ubiquinone biosynthesis (AarF/ABC1/UbiB family)